MGTSLSLSGEEEDVAADGDADGNEGAPSKHVNARYVHWLVSDPTRVQEAFASVWRACSADETASSAPRDVVLKVMLSVIVEFERGCNGDDDNAAGDGHDGGNGRDGNKQGASKTTRQLSQIIGMLPEWLTRTEAMHLFRTVLHSAQASLAMKSSGSGDGATIDWSPAQANSPSGASPATLGSLDVNASSPASGAAGSPSVGDPSSPTPLGNGGGFSPPKALLTRTAARKEDTHPSLSEALGRAKDALLAATGAASLQHPALRATMLPPQSAALPTRQELEAENERLWNQSELLEASLRDELAVVRMLEDELQSANGSSAALSLNGGHGGTTLLALEMEAHASQQEASRLACEIRISEGELNSHESHVSSQQRDIARLALERAEEEAAADELAREVRDLHQELRQCLRQCSSLDGEIASEEARSAALREAFDGRRARFATAEAAARNAELSTMRATRRRIAAETSARNEWFAVEEAQQERAHRSAELNLRLSALSEAVVEARALSSSVYGESREAEGFAGNAADASMRDAAVRASLRASRAELLLIKVECDAEGAANERLASELEELEEGRRLLEGQEERTAPLAALAGDGDDAAALELERTLSAMRAVEQRSDELRRSEAALWSQLQRARAGGGDAEISAASSAPAASAEESAAESLWAEARALGAEFGEAEAALVRQGVERMHGSAGAATASLRTAIENAQLREAQSSDELSAVFSEVVASLERRQELQAQVSALEGSVATGLAGASADASSGRRRSGRERTRSRSP
eukprot:TRINITY_DN28763_c0_g1_i1.p1 TRINITY_DN28763_c0_g1~~TRINITY_DN28763_c0_g1_i1.p1  ORF type:complete len:769 (+),score=227.26 TRINITY_DN28763_c0_g1_i1:105-2411(+)